MLMGKARKHTYQGLGTGEGFLNSTPVSPANAGQMGPRVCTMKETHCLGTAFRVRARFVSQRGSTSTQRTRGGGGEHQSKSGLLELVQWSRACSTQA